MIDVLNETIESLVALQKAGTVSSVEITKAYLAQIAKHNVEGLGIRAVIEVNPDALMIAASLDRDLAQGIWRGPLHGVPILVKDNLDTGDTMQTTAGSVALEGHRATKDSTVVRKLREAGAVIIGKANLTEWANFISDHMENGYSSRGGQTLCPYGPGVFDVGGSSAGSGAGVAAGFAAAAIGTETSGSILSPSSNNSLVGIKPTVGLVSRAGIIPISMSQDTAGPMTKTVRDAAILLSVIAGEDPLDSATHSTTALVEDYSKQLEKGRLQGARLGVVRGAYVNYLSDAEKTLYEAALEALKAAGATLVDVELADRGEDDNMDVMVHEFKVALNAYLAGTEETLPARTLTELIVYNQRHADVALKYGQALFLQADQTSGRLTEAKYTESRLKDLEWSQAQGIDQALSAHQLDALVFGAYFGCSIAAKAGYPSVTVPAGYTEEGKPMGVTFTGTAFSEATLVGLAYDYEQQTKHRVAPNLA